MRALPEEISKRTAVLATVFILAVLGFRLLPSYWTDFFLIDDATLTEAPAFHAASATESLRLLLTPGTQVDFYPVRDASAAVDRALCGPMNPGCHRIQGWLLFAAITFLLLAVLRSHSGSYLTATLLTACFVFHPLQAESLIWISARKDLWGLLFALGLWYLASREKDRPLPRFFAGVALLLSKANYLLLPTLAEALAGFKTRRWFSVFSAGAAGAVLGAIHWRQYHVFTPVSYARPFAEKLPLAAINVGKYAEALFGTVDFRFSFDFGEAWVLAHPYERTLGSLGLGALLVAFFFAWRRGSRAVAPLAALTVLWVPVSALFSDHLIVFASRYALPLLPFALMIPAATRWTRAGRVRLHGALLLWLVFLYPQQGLDVDRWSEPLSLWTSQLQKDPRHVETRLNLAAELESASRAHPSDLSLLDDWHLETEALEKLCSLEQGRLPLSCYFYRLTRFKLDAPTDDLKPPLEILDATYERLGDADRAFAGKTHLKMRVLLSRLNGTPVPLEVPSDSISIESAPLSNLLTWKTICLAQGPGPALAFLDELKRRGLFDLSLWRRAFVVYGKTHPSFLVDEMNLCAGDHLRLK